MDAEIDMQRKTLLKGYVVRNFWRNGARASENKNTLDSMLKLCSSVGLQAEAPAAEAANEAPTDPFRDARGNSRTGLQGLHII